jgi:MFS family permease
MTPVSGQLSDIYGKKKILIVMVIIYLIGAAIGGVGRDFYMLIAARVLQGVGLSIIPALVLNRLSPKCQNHLPEQRGEMGRIANRIVDEIMRRASQSVLIRLEDSNSRSME